MPRDARRSLAGARRMQICPGAGASPSASAIRFRRRRSSPTIRAPNGRRLRALRLLSLSRPDCSWQQATAGWFVLGPAPGGGQRRAPGHEGAERVCRRCRRTTGRRVPAAPAETAPIHWADDRLRCRRSSTGSLVRRPAARTRWASPVGRHAHYALRALRSSRALEIILAAPPDRW